MKQQLYLVFGGELVKPTSQEFSRPSELHTVGIFDNYETAYKAWRGATAATMDDAHMRYFIVALDKFLSPEK